MEKRLVRISVLLFACISAYTIRLHALTTYGNVIHEFDPWFNYRATVYLQENGPTKFFDWYDDKAWYPIGRPVGGTIYPGMQFTAVGIWKCLQFFGFSMSLNDVCCYVPVWFGVLASLFIGLLGYECTGDVDVGIISTVIMAIIPAHLMRSVGGGYDNESVAVTAMCATFYFWCRSLRTTDSYWYGIATAVSYFYMVAAWGGYVFVSNMIALHAVALIALGRHSRQLHYAYSLFYVLGTFSAIQIPVVGMAPFKSLEQMGALGVFVLLQLWWLLNQIRVRQDPSEDWSPKQIRQFYVRILSGVTVVTSVLIGVLSQSGYFGPVSSRVRSLFVPHTRTGNPLVDSVAEHRPADANAYLNYLQNMFYWYPVGMVCLCWTRTDSNIFLLLYGCVAYYFSSKMVRLILLMGPITSVLAATSLCSLSKWSIEVLTGPAKKVLLRIDHRIQKITSVFILATVCLSSVSFWNYSREIASDLSHPSIMFQATLRNGKSIIVDDYRQAYWWLRDTTPLDSRVLAWWDYGYQINGIAERTTLADGNTWNHEHIAMLGRCLVSAEKESHTMVRHLADYVLVWAGSGGDLGKSPHMARISNSVYNTTCPNDPTCSQFGFDSASKPTPMMAASMLYKLHEGVADPNLFEHVYDSPHGLVRIYRVKNGSQTSKEWVLHNPRQYPPVLEDMLQNKEDFKQVEDFNK